MPSRSTHQVWDKLSQTPAPVLCLSMLPKRWTPRHVGILAASFIVLWTIWHVLVPSDSLSFSIPLSPSAPLTPPEEWERRKGRVRDAYMHSYRGWVKHAAPHDEVMPLTGKAINNFNGWGVTLFDSLDTMLLMGLNDEFKRALPLVGKATFEMEEDKTAPFFETVIRYLGGLLSAYAISGEPILLERADDLARALDPAFDSESGLPWYSVNTVTGRIKGPQIAVLAEVASCQMEYAYLAKLTGDKKWFNRADKIIRALEHADLSEYGGMMPVRWNVTSGQPWHSLRVLSVGAAADSAHEYLLKQYLLTAKSDKANLEMYLRTTTQIMTQLIYLSQTRHLMYVTDTSAASSVPSHIFEHLSCFLPGLFALGAHTLPLNNLEELGISWLDLAKDLPRDLQVKYKLLAKYNLKDLHMWVAEGLTQSCWLTYADQPTGLGPDEVVMDRQPRSGWVKEGFGYIGGGVEGDFGSGKWFDALEKWRKSGARGAPPGTAPRAPVVYDENEVWKGPEKGHARDYSSKKTDYLLRPETLESIYYMWKVTGDARWRERGWAIFQAIEKETKVDNGYAAVKAVNKVPPPKADSQPSYFLAETLKYLYLMFSDDDPIDLDKWVFNTEAHPFRVFEWTEQEKLKFGIA